MPAFLNVAIVGAGLIGTSLAMALRERTPEVAVSTFDRSDDPLRAAGADLVVLCAPILVNQEVVATIKPVLRAGTLITDTGSTKASMVAVAHGVRFIGGHPVAGGTGTGPAHARADLFDDCTWILTPPPATEPTDLERLSAFVESVGARPAVMEAGEHDRLFAFISHLPQLVISALMDVVGGRSGLEGLRLAGAGLRDSTRLAESSPDIWLDVASTNRDAIRTALDELMARLAALRDDEDGRVLQRTFEGARRWKGVLQAGGPRDA